MALNANQVLEVRTTGSDTNSGGFRSGGSGTDWSQQDSPQYSVTDGVTNGTTTITSATANFGTDVVHNLIYIAGGTGSITGVWREITARTNSTTITVDSATGLTSGTGVTLNIGGALASPGLAAALMAVSGQKAWVKSGAYSITTSTPGSGGPVVLTASVRCAMQGYQTSRGDHTGARPVLTWTASAPGGQTYVITTSGATTFPQLVDNMEVDGNSVSNVSGINNNASSSHVSRCKVSNCDQSSQIGINSSNAAALTSYCQAVNCTIGFAGTTSAIMPNIGSVAIGCGTGFSNGTGFVNCLAHACTTAGFSMPQKSFLANCTADSTSSGSGFVVTADSLLVNCLSTNNSAYGYDVDVNEVRLMTCANYNNTSGRNDVALTSDLDPITLTEDPYVNLAADDFRPNTAAGGGALLRAAGIGVFGQTNNTDVGAVQHSDAAGGGMLIHPGMAGGMRA